ncbi:hypothetical protein E2C01_004401 [Portunus trituberculatus]|uniref:Uncharacterized protein n=1 Tax=Portunus trituberculatus TaxID=210409 RepID=A0A5B7CPR8_PORTR|nr:hypothetical protein [Portunus trituberculatus]
MDVPKSKSEGKSEDQFERLLERSRDRYSIFFVLMKRRQTVPWGVTLALTRPWRWLWLRPLHLSLLRDMAAT